MNGMLASRLDHKHTVVHPVVHPYQPCLKSQPTDTAARKPAPKRDSPFWLPASENGESTTEDFSSCKARLSNPRQGPRTRGYRRPASHQRLANRRYWNLLPNSPAEPVFLGRGLVAYIYIYVYIYILCMYIYIYMTGPEAAKPRYSKTTT